MNPNQQLDFNQDMVENFMLFLHNMQLQHSTILSAQVSQMNTFNNLLYSSARERPLPRTSTFPQMRTHGIFLNRQSSSPNLGEFLNNNVDVFPSPEQINNSTELYTFENITNPQNTTCPIRNESFSSNDIVIKISHCGHIFFPNEFYGWFRNHVRCPMCRHDIRDSSNNDFFRNRAQFDISYNIFNGIEQVVPQQPNDTSNSQLNTNNSNLMHSEQQLASIPRTLSNELVNQYNMFTDLSNNQIEIAVSLTSQHVLDVSTNYID